MLNEWLDAIYMMMMETKYEMNSFHLQSQQPANDDDDLQNINKLNLFISYTFNCDTSLDWIGLCMNFL